MARYRDGGGEGRERDIGLIGQEDRGPDKVSLVGLVRIGPGGGRYGHAQQEEQKQFLESQLHNPRGFYAVYRKRAEPSIGILGGGVLGL